MITKTWQRWTTLAFLLPSLAATTQEPPPPDTSQQAVSPVDTPRVPDSISVAATPADDAIETRLADILQATEWFSQTVVEVRDGVAFLKGNTEEADKRTWASELASNTEGVAAVVNQIEVEKEFNVEDS